MLIWFILISGILRRTKSSYSNVRWPFNVQLFWIITFWYGRRWGKLTFFLFNLNNKLYCIMYYWKKSITKQLLWLESGERYSSFFILGFLNIFDFYFLDCNSIAAAASVRILDVQFLATVHVLRPSWSKNQ